MSHLTKYISYVLAVLHLMMRYSQSLDTITSPSVSVTSQSVSVTSTSVSISSYGVSVTLDCLATEAQNWTKISSPIHEGDQFGTRQFRHWILPDLTTLFVNHTGHRDIILKQNYSLYIHQVKRHHLGDYLCSVEDKSRHALYSRVHLYFYTQPIWDVYYKNFITAFIASGSVLLVITVICSIRRLRYKKRHSLDGDSFMTEQDETSHHKPSSGRVNMGYYNNSNDGVTCM